MRRGWAALSAAALAAFGGGGEASAQDQATALLEDAAARYTRVSTLCADFVQNLVVPLLEQERTASGRLCQARPNLFAMRFSQPAGDVVVIDGTTFWYYFHSNDPRQAFRAPAERAGGQDFHREFLDNPLGKYAATYEGEEQVGGAATHRLRLIPRARASYRAAVLWLEDGTSLLRQIRIEEENGSRRTITLSSIEFDVTPPAGFFTFTPPASVTTLDVQR
jgi:outer membrane lipoprotein-sorting protein